VCGVKLLREGSGRSDIPERAMSGMVDCSCVVIGSKVGRRNPIQLSKHSEFITRRWNCWYERESDCGMRDGFDGSVSVSVAVGVILHLFINDKRGYRYLNSHDQRVPT